MNMMSVCFYIICIARQNVSHIHYVRPIIQFEYLYIEAAFMHLSWWWTAEWCDSHSKTTKLMSPNMKWNEMRSGITELLHILFGIWKKATTTCQCQTKFNRVCWFVVINSTYFKGCQTHNALGFCCPIEYDATVFFFILPQHILGLWIEQSNFQEKLTKRILLMKIFHFPLRLEKKIGQVFVVYVLHE